MHTSVYIAASLDGYIARSDGGLDWLENLASIEGEDYGYTEFISEIDALIMGRKTYETVVAKDIPWPYTMPVTVLSSRRMEIPERLSHSVRHRALPPAQVVAELSAQGYRGAWIDGGHTVRAFLRAGLVQYICITTIPVILGDGIPLLAGVGKEIGLRLKRCRSWANGVTQSEYVVAK